MKNSLLQNRNYRSIMAMLLALVMIVVTVNVNDFVVNAASRPKLQKTKLQLVEGKTATLKIQKIPKGSKVVKTKWEVQKKNVLKLTISGSKVKKKKAKEAKVKALKPGKSTVYCTITYQVKKSGKWKTRKNKLKAVVTVVSDSEEAPVPTDAGSPQGTATSSPDGNTTSTPSDHTNLPEETSGSSDNTTAPQDTTAPTVAPTPTPIITPTPTPEILTWTGLMVKTKWTPDGNIDGSYSETSCSAGLSVISDSSCWNFQITSTKWDQYNYPVMKCYRAENDTTTETLDIWYGSNSDEQVAYPFGEWNGKAIALDKTQVSSGIRIANNTPICKIEICEGETSGEHEKDIGSDDFSKTALEFSKDMKIGWNVGNSMDAVINGGTYVSGTSGLAVETGWGLPKITENLVKAVKEAGFNTIRVPVTWINHTDPNNNYQIDEMWMDRVEEVVQYCTSNGLYVLLNVHHDGSDDANSGSWLGPESGNVTEMKTQYKRIWEQIADRFKGYSNLLLFESMNEFHHGYGNPSQAYYTVQNELHQIFVDTVRASGGNNVKRYLIIPGYNTNIDQTIAGLKLPTDTCENHLMVEVHYYDPFDFAGDDHKEKEDQWGTDFSSASASASSGWGQEKYLMAQLEKMKTNYVNKGIPVVLGEFGAEKRYDSSNEKYRIYYLQYMVKYCSEYGLLPVYWDNGSTFRLFDRNTYEVAYPDVVSGMMDALKPGYTIPIP